MKEENEIRDWLPSMGLMVSVAGIVIVLAAIAFISERSPGILNAGAQECRASYRKAGTATDSAIIDEQRPSTQTGRKPNSETCGYWRKVGLTR